MNKEALSIGATQLTYKGKDWHTGLLTIEQANKEEKQYNTTAILYYAKAIFKSKNLNVKSLKAVSLSFMSKAK